MPLLPLLVCAFLQQIGCEEDTTYPNGDTSAAKPKLIEPQGEHLYTDATFAEMYQLFVLRNLTTPEKTMLWNTKYQGRWVRWTGSLLAMTRYDLKMRQIKNTPTFDVSVRLNEPQRSQLRKVMKPDRFYTYVGRLESYSELFRTIYLDQGSVLTPEGTAPVELVPVPSPLRILPLPTSTPKPNSNPDLLPIRDKNDPPKP